jgi:small-conductance mechanosensitive channel
VSVPGEKEVRAADGLKHVVSQKSGAAGGVIETLDRWAIDLGTWRVSLWDAIVFVFSMTRLDTTQQLLAEKIVTIVVWAVAILLGIDILGIDLTALAVFSGAFGLAIGFGLQKTFGNLIAGIILLMDRSIKPGDVIAIADAGGQPTFGQIRKIGIRAVSLTTRDQKEYLIPNENLMINQVENWSYSSRNVRVQVPVSVGYHCDIKLAEQLMLEAAKGAKRVLTTPPPVVWLEALGESGIQFKVHCWINDPEEGIGSVRSDVLKRLWELFQQHGIEVPFPQRDLTLKDSEQLQQLLAVLAHREAQPEA